MYGNVGSYSKRSEDLPFPSLKELQEWVYRITYSILKPSPLRPEEVLPRSALFNENHIEGSISEDLNETKPTETIPKTIEIDPFEIKAIESNLSESTEILKKGDDSVFNPVEFHHHRSIETESRRESFCITTEVLPSTEPEPISFRSRSFDPCFSIQHIRMQLASFPIDLENIVLD